MLDYKIITLYISKLAITIYRESGTSGPETVDWAVALEIEELAENLTRSLPRVPRGSLRPYVSSRGFGRASFPRSVSKAPGKVRETANCAVEESELVAATKLLAWLNSNSDQNRPSAPVQWGSEVRWSESSDEDSEGSDSLVGDAATPPRSYSPVTELSAISPGGVLVNGLAEDDVALENWDSGETDAATVADTACSLV